MSVPIDLLIEAKHEVTSLIGQGKLLSPREAWLLSGHTTGNETLWSVALRMSQDQPCSAQELCDALERIFPLYTEGRGQLAQSWHDYLDRPSPW